MNTISFWPILVASLIAFGISALWYSPVLFGAEWMETVKTNSDSSKGIWKRYVMQFVVTVIMFLVIAFAMTSSNTIGTADGAIVGFIAWLGFMLPTTVSNMLWRNDSFKMSMIETVNNLVVLIIGGAIIGTWQ